MPTGVSHLHQVKNDQMVMLPFFGANHTAMGDCFGLAVLLKQRVYNSFIFIEVSTAQQLYWVYKIIVEIAVSVYVCVLMIKTLDRDLRRCLSFI